MKNKSLSFISKFRYIIKSTREFKKFAILSIVFVALETVFECIIPFIMQMLIDQMGEMSALGVINRSEYLNTVLTYASILVALAICSLICGITAGKMSAYASCGFARNLREDEFKKITQYSFKNIDKFSTSSLITRQTTDVTNIQFAFMMLIRIAIRAPLMFVFSFVMALVVALPISWIFAITIPLISLIFIILMPPATRLFVKLFRKYDDINEEVEEDVRGMRVVKSYAREEYHKEKFHKQSLELSKGFGKVEMMLSASNPAVQAVFYTSMSLILFIGSFIVIDLASYDGNAITYGRLTIGSVSSMITYSAQVLSSVMMFSMVLFMIIMSVPGVNRVYEVLKEEPSIKNSSDPIYEVKSGDIVFKDVSFKYSENAEKYALSHVNLEIKSGETIGILGGTGSSKSTLVNLLSRFYDTTEGEVLVGGVNVKDYDLKTLRNNVSMVLQKNVLFSGTINENLRWGNKDATDEEIKEACRIAQADSFIESFPKGYENHIEQGGTNVSGGQRQRLCIARALLKNPKVLILDDSTSAVDTKTDAFIRKGLKESLPGVTKIIIAQRVSSVQDADRIIVMDNGLINGVGTHEELLKSNQIYQEVYEIQNRIGGGNENEK